MEVFVVLVICAVGVMISKANTSSKCKKQKKVFESNQNEYLKDNKIQATAEYGFANDFYIKNKKWKNCNSARFIIDRYQKKAVIISKNGRNEIIPFSNILGCEIIADSNATGGVGEIVMGGVLKVLAGDAGAIVDAVTAKKHIMSYKVIIYKNDILNPKAEIVLISSRRATNSKDCVNAIQFAESVNATIKAILNSNKQKPC